MEVADAAKKADVIQILIPDEHQGAVYREQIAKGLTKGKTLMFSHGFNIHFGQIVPPADVDVVMVAPKGPGHMVRRTYTEGKGCSRTHRYPPGCFWKCTETCSCLCRRNWEPPVQLSLRHHSARRPRLISVGEQAVLCGGMTSLIRAGFETLVEAGYAPEMAYLEVLPETKLIVDLIL
jgi:Ketol-acid reductoisomerase